jgi:WD40 repeat protein
MHPQTIPSASPSAPASPTGPPHAAKLVAELKGHTNAVTVLAFTTDRSLLASAGRDGPVRIWTVASQSGERASVTKSGEIFRALAFAPTGRVLAAGAGSQSGLGWVFNLTDKSPQEVATLRGARGQIAALAFSPDGKLVAGAGEDQTLRIWEPGPGFRGDSRAILLGHTRAITAVTFAPDGTTVATAAQDATVRLWTLGRIRSSQRAVLTHPAEVGALAFLPDGKTLATGCRDGVIRLWDASAINPTVRAELTGLAGGARVVLAPDAATLVGVNDGTRVLNWDLQSGKVLREWEVPGAPASGVALTPDGRYLARGTASGPIELYRVAEKRA